MSWPSDKGDRKGEQIAHPPGMAGGGSAQWKINEPVFVKMS